MRKLALHWQILIAIVLAVVVGSFVKANTTDTFAPNIFSVPFVAIFDYVGTMFLNALKMIIVPLITSSIIVGVAGIGSGGNLGALGGKTLVFYATTTLAAILVFYRRRIWRLLSVDLWVIPLLIVGTLPAVAVGLAIKATPWGATLELSLIHISEPTRQPATSRMPSSA